MPIGFFDIESLPKASFDGIVDTTVARIATCATCKQFKNCNSPEIAAIGNGEKKILIITGAVTRAEENSGNQKHSNNYSYLKKHFMLCGIDIEKDCWYTHAIKCYFKGKSSNGMVNACHNKLLMEIKTLDPSHIIVTDQLAWDVLLNDRLEGRVAHASHYDWCGEIIPDQKLKKWVYPIYDPHWVLEEDEKQANKFILHWHKQIKNVYDRKLPIMSPEKRCKVIDSIGLAYEALDVINTWKVFAFDYETTGIKPFNAGHDIYYASFSNGEISYGFPLFKDKDFRRAVVKVLRNDAVKIAHNLSFESMWSKHILGTHVNNFNHDTMIAQHCVHNKKPVGLKFLSYARYGFMGYDADASEYIESSTDDTKMYGANAMNRISIAPVKKASLYCAMDSLFTFWLYEDLLDELKKNNGMEGYTFFIEAQKALNQATMNGMKLDYDKLLEHEKKLTLLLAPLYKEIMNNDYIVKTWDGGYKFNPKSDYDVRILLYKLLKFPIIKRTDKGEPSADEEALEFYKEKCNIIPPLLEYRRWSKALNTYIGQYKRENNNGALHAFFGISHVATFRGNSSRPNLQNCPVRDAEVRDVIRSLLLPKRGHRLIEYDYKANEVGGAASLSGDPELIRYVSDTSSDMHLDASVGLYLLEKDKINKALRNVTKGPFIFAEFYGSYWKQTAAGVWNEIYIKNPEKVFGIDVVAHLRSKGIKTYEDWEQHVRENERVLWQERFPVYQQWRERTYAFFLKHGYVDFPNGFRYYGPASKNELLNAPVQGPSFHCQLWCFTEVTKTLMDRKMDSHLVGQVHDSILASVLPEEEDLVDEWIYEFGTQKVKEHYDWIKVPLMIEKGSTGIDEPWSMKKDKGYLKGNKND